MNPSPPRGVHADREKEKQRITACMQMLCFQRLSLLVGSHSRYTLTAESHSIVVVCPLFENVGLAATGRTYSSTDGAKSVPHYH